MKLLSFSVLAAAALSAPAAGQPLYQQGVPPPPPNAFQPTYKIRGAVVTSFARPAFASGVLHTYVEIHVRAPGNISYVLHHTYLSPDQFTPPVGSICTIAFHYGAWAFVENGRARLPDYNRPSLVADELACNTGTTEAG